MKAEIDLLYSLILCFYSFLRDLFYKILFFLLRSYCFFRSFDFSIVEYFFFSEILFYNLERSSVNASLFS